MCFPCLFPNTFVLSRAIKVKHMMIIINKKIIDNPVYMGKIAYGEMSMLWKRNVWQHCKSREER